MIKKLRIKLIVASVVSLFVVLVVIISAVSALSYKKVVSDADNILSVLAENDGTFPDMPPHNSLRTVRHG